MKNTFTLRLLLITAILFTFFSQKVNAQASTANYVFSSSTTASLESMSSGTTELSATGTYRDDVSLALTNIGFEFPFMGNIYTQFSLNTNGQVRLGSTVIGGTSQSPAASVPLISALGGDNGLQLLDGQVRYKVTGSAPNRILIIEYNGLRIPHSTTAGTSSQFQTLLYESSGKIEFKYGVMHNNGSSQSRTIYFSSSNTSSSVGSVTIGASPSYQTNASPSPNSIADGALIANLSGASDGNRIAYTFTPNAGAAAPTGFAVTNLGAGSMTINWTDNAADETGYIVCISSDGGTTFTNSSGVLAANTATYNVTGLSASTTYHYKIYAMKEIGGTALTGSQATNAASFSGTKTIGAAGADFTSLTAAIASATLNGLSGATILSLQSDYVSSVETFPLTIGNIIGNSGTNTLTIRPSVTGLSITSTNTTATIDLNGAQNVILDGRVNGTGSTKDLIIANTSAATGGTAIRFINEGSSNTVKFAILRAVFSSNTSGVVNFSTTTGANGNDNNLIDNCDIDCGAGATSAPAAGTAAHNGVYSSGTTTTTATNNSSNTISNCNIFNFFITTVSTVAGVNLAGGNTDWTITANSIYQTASRTTTAVSTMNGIFINNSSSGNNFTITNNFIGGSAASCGGSAWTVTGNFANRYRALSITCGIVTASSIQGNTIANFNVISSSGASTAPGIFCGIYAVTGSVNIGNLVANTIGSTTGTGSITVQSQTTGAISYGIVVDGSTATYLVNNNGIGSMTTTGNTTSISHTLTGILVQAATTATVSSNTIGSTATANSMNASNASTSSTTQISRGIHNTSSAVINITNNTIANLNNAYVPSSANSSNQMTGILTTSGTITITGNTVRNFTLSANATGTSTTTGIIGISNSSTTAGLTISQNTIHTLSNTHATSVTGIIGLNNSGPTTGTNVVARNLIHSLKLATSSVGIIYGISVTAGTTTYQNNMIRLGLDETGASLTAAYDIRGINEPLGTDNFYHNSVFIGGTGVVSGTTNTFAFNSAQTSNTRAFQNNIFVNNRSNTSGTGLNVAYFVAGTLPLPTGLTSNTNLLFANGTGGTLIRHGTTNYTLSAWRTASGLDNLTHQGDPGFVAPLGNSSTLDLHISGTTAAEANGASIAAVTDDFDGSTRSGLTAHDIGADAGNFTTSDGSPVSITYTNLTSGTASNRVLTNFATITDNTGVSGTSKPRIYYKKSTDADAFVGNTSASNGWKFVVASNSTSPYSFTIDYSIINGGSVADGNTIQYFVVAQDAANNFSSTPDGATASGNPPVENINAKSTTVNTYTIVAATLSGTFNVGAGQTYTSLTGGVGGFFADVNAKIITGNITVNITSDITEDGTNSLNALNEDPFNSNFTFTIQPSTNVMRTISVPNLGSGTPMININGADNVSIDGRSGGSGSFLTFSNTNATPANTGAAIQFTNGSLSATLRNTIIESNATTATRGSVIIGATGTNNVTITNNDIRDAVSTGTVGQAANAVYSNSALNTVSVTNNNIFNFSAVGILFTNVANSCTLTGNSFYATSTSTSTAQTGISIQTGNSHTITGNFIGGNTSSAGGTAWVNSAAVTFKGITTAGSTTTANSIQNNTVQNISLTSTGSATFTGIEVTSGLANVGTSTGNTIGHTATASSITAAGTSPTTGINISSTSAVTVSNNLIANIVGSNVGTSATIRGIVYSGSGTPVISLNIIKNITASTAATSSSAPAVVGILSSSTNVTQSITQNQIFTLQSSGSGFATFCGGIVVSGSGSAGTIGRNRIYGLTNNSNNASCGIVGIHLFNGSWTTVNNMISITNAANSNDPIIRGLWENTATSTTQNILFNSIRIGGTASSSTNTFGFNRAIGCTIVMRNNIFINERSGGTGKHYAVANTASTPATGWSASAANFNTYFSSVAANVGLWTTDATLAQFQSSSAGDANSNSVDINFTDEANGDLHITGASLGSANLNGVLVSTVTDDFDGDVRPSTTGTPYKGADHVAGSPLPIELFKFTGSAKPDFNALTWITASEINSSHFEVERLNTDKTFENIARVTAAGNSREINQYQFHDATFTKSNAIEYYRLKMVDRDNHFKYSDVIAVKRNVDLNPSVSLYPNPTTEILNVMISNADVTKIQVRVLDVVGKIIYENNNLMSNEINNIPVADFPSGMYTLQVFGLSENINQKFIKK